MIQGSRDPFGTPDELRPVLAPLPAPVTLHVVDKGDHSLAPSTAAAKQTYGEVQDVIAWWITGG